MEQRAFREAERLWQTEQNVAIEANIIGALILNAYLACSGEHSIPSHYMRHAVVLAQRMELYDEASLANVYVASPGKERRAHSRAVLAWGLFAHQAYFCCAFNEIPLLQVPPPIAIPSPHSDKDDETWLPFPQRFPQKRSLTSTRFTARASLWRIGNECVSLYRQYANRPASTEHLLHAFALFERLRLWHDDLDSKLTSLYDAPPHIFQLYTDYHRIVTDLLRPFVDASLFVKATWPDRERYSSAVREACTSSQRQIRFLMQELDRQFPASPLPLGTVNPLVTVCYDALAQLPRNMDAESPSSGSRPSSRAFSSFQFPSASDDSRALDSDESYYLCLCLRMLHRMCKAFTICPIILQGIFQVARRQRVELPAEAKQIEKTMKQTYWQSGLATQPPGTIKNSLAIDLGLMHLDAEKARLDSLILETKQINIEDK
ncbi:hypothetical protein EJ03DRAFT_349121 [Teratosphaeria nubilosa]|uniref:Transcription factor domain-containing protein n=1 Tax=Teratosphaeria nubilosa TaxID=161662 RepID=A0A6G1LGA5_9PEZI|nr:hypothetical protein EJ03DRAFT_349121 [Teratosphaeria nubilosa]